MLMAWLSVGGVTGKKAAKPVTAVQDCVLKFVSVKPLDEE